ncbi:MAG: nucleotidyltransferase family protein [Butyrivibrio sp.]|nr:nucleotidyltransferase family protein [Butyrivibrio sp.]
MKTAAVIAEYNPFHKGHIYHIEQTRRLSGADCVVALMSGSFVQRGAPAFADKYTRARCALDFADLVLELPTVYAVSGAESFASGAVSLLSSLGGIDFLSFGTECSPSDFGALYGVSEILADEPDSYTRLLKKGLSKGRGFPASRAAALTEYTGDESFSALLSSPNNILAAEYIKALIRQGSEIKPFPVKRLGAYRLADGEKADGFAGADEVRRLYRLKGPEGIRDALGESAFDILNGARERTLPVYSDDIGGLLYYAVSVNSDSPERFSDVGEALAGRLRRVLSDCAVSELSDFETLAARLKSRELTYTRICRALIHILLDIRQEDADRLAADGYPAYARVLGFNAVGREFLSSVKKTAALPIISNCADAYSSLTPERKYLFDKDLLASRIYGGILYSKYKTAPIDDFRSRPIINF